MQKKKSVRHGSAWRKELARGKARLKAQGGGAVLVKTYRLWFGKEKASKK